MKVCTFFFILLEQILTVVGNVSDVERGIVEAKESFIRQIKPNLQDNPVIIELANRMDRKEKETLLKSEDYRGKMKYAKKDASSEYDMAKRPASASFKSRDTPPNEGWNKLEEKNVRHKSKKGDLEGIPEEPIKVESLCQCSVDCTEETASLVENTSAKEVTTIADWEQPPTQVISFSLHNISHTSRITALKGLHYIEQPSFRPRTVNYM